MCLFHHLPPLCPIPSHQSLWPGLFLRLTMVSASMHAPPTGRGILFQTRPGCGTPATSQNACQPPPQLLALKFTLQSPAKLCAASRPLRLLQGASCFCSNGTSLERPSLTTLAACPAFFSSWHLVHPDLVFCDRCFAGVPLEQKQAW